MNSQIQLESTITCPVCQEQATLSMPTNSCLWFYHCKKCHSTLKPLPGDCCIFCSYGSVPCPLIQQQNQE